MDTIRPALREEDVDSVEELLNIVNGLRRDNDELRHIVIKNQHAQAAIFAKALKGLKELLCLIAVGGSSWYMFNTLPEESKQEFSAKFIQYGLAALVSAGGLKKLFGEKDEVNEIESGYFGYSELDQSGSMEGDRRR